MWSMISPRPRVDACEGVLWQQRGEVPEPVAVALIGSVESTSATSPVGAEGDRALAEPMSDRVRVEARQRAPFQEWDATLQHQSPHVPHADAEVPRDLLNVKELR